MDDEENYIVVGETARTATAMTTNYSVRTLPEAQNMTNRGNKPMTLTRVATSKQ